MFSRRCYTASPVMYLIVRKGRNVSFQNIYLAQRLFNNKHLTKTTDPIFCQVFDQLEKGFTSLRFLIHLVGECVRQKQSDSLKKPWKLFQICWC